MAKFMDVHSGFVGVTEKQLQEAHDRDLAIEKDEGVHFERAWLDPDSGKVFCL
ncbi:MAG: nickel-binding protein, partial [Candidatus Limnocylindria bacterium]